jgi:outer membrane biosynthesis protein TonB
MGRVIIQFKVKKIGKVVDARIVTVVSQPLD